MTRIEKLLYTLTLSIALWGFAGCDGMPFDATADAGTDAECTEWGRVSTCPDGTVGCDRMVCLSYAPPACPPGPWPCTAEVSK
jgi:hypothetical protein